MRRNFLAGCFHHCIELRKLQHQALLRLIDRLFYGDMFQAAPLFCIFIQDRLDPHDRIENIRPCVTFEGSEPVQIKNIIFRRLVREIAILDRCQSYHFRGPLCLLLVNLIPLRLCILPDLTNHFLIDLLDQGFQAHDPAFSCLKRLSILTIHGAETNMHQLCICIYQSSLPRAAEHLFKIQFLPLVRQIDHLVWVVLCHAIQDRRQIRGIIKGRTI